MRVTRTSTTPYEVICDTSLTRTCGCEEMLVVQGGRGHLQTVEVTVEVDSPMGRSVVGTATIHPDLTTPNGSQCDGPCGAGNATVVIDDPPPP